MSKEIFGCYNLGGVLLVLSELGPVMPLSTLQCSGSLYHPAWCGCKVLALRSSSLQVSSLSFYTLPVGELGCLAWGMSPSVSVADCTHGPLSSGPRVRVRLRFCSFRGFYLTCAAPTPVLFAVNHFQRWSLEHGYGWWCALWLFFSFLKSANFVSQSSVTHGPPFSVFDKQGTDWTSSQNFVSFTKASFAEKIIFIQARGMRVICKGILQGWEKNPTWLWF